MKQTEPWLWRIACAILLGLQLYAGSSPTLVITPQYKLMLAVCFCILLTLAVRPGRGKTNRTLWLLLLFAYYLWMLADLLFFDAAFGRTAGRGGVNLEPLHTIRNYLRAYRRGNIPLGPVVLNLAGNLAAFAPMAVFLPALFRAQRNILLFFVTVFLMVATVEIVQHITNTGSCDIDDLILNTAGALALWILLLPYRLCKSKGTG